MAAALYAREDQSRLFCFTENNRAAAAGPLTDCSGKGLLSVHQPAGSGVRWSGKREGKGERETPRGRGGQRERVQGENRPLHNDIHNSIGKQGAVWWEQTD